MVDELKKIDLQYIEVGNGEDFLCCWSGCDRLADQYHGWWGDACFCSKHDLVMLNSYNAYIRLHPRYPSGDPEEKF
jgi:hypothetical protein